MNDAERLAAIKAVITNYMNGECGEPQEADAHDFLMEIEALVDPEGQKDRIGT